MRSCLVSNKTQSVICDDLRLTNYLFDLKKTSNITGTPIEKLVDGMTLKDKADLVEGEFLCGDLSGFGKNGEKLSYMSF